MHLGQMRRIWLGKRVVGAEYITLRRLCLGDEGPPKVRGGIESSKTVRPRMGRNFCPKLPTPPHPETGSPLGKIEKPG
jgi:hypothetical protein